MKWRKLGQSFSLREHRSSWMESHAQNPSPLVLPDRIRVYINTRGVAQGGMPMSQPAYVDVQRSDPTQVLGVSDGPVLSHGALGCFDQHGCMASSVIANGDALWMYYVGWSRCVAVPYNWAIGLAVSRDGGRHFERMFQGPVVGAHENEPYLQNGQFVVRDAPNDWHMWYSTGKAWLETDGKMESRYVLTYATSTDGVRWARTGAPIVGCAVENETQTTPTVFSTGGLHHMYFAYRHSTDFRNAARGYRIGYATSRDRKTWERDDARGGLDVSPSGWDSQMVCYPHVCRVEDKTYMFYCGNDFGRDGFGCAVLDG